MNKKNLLYIVTLIALTLTACGAPAAPTPQPVSTTGPDLALTVTAQASLLETVLAPTLTPEATQTPIPFFTETPSKVIVSVSADTNCRSGPSLEYDIVGALVVGQQAEVVGKNAASNYWLIDNPNAAGTCWLWGEYATFSGDPFSLQEVAAPPTVTPRAAGAPVIDRVVVRPDSSGQAVVVHLDVYYIDGEGDANFVDWQVISTSVEVTGTMKDLNISPSLNQRKGSVITATWGCGTKQYDVALAVSIHDQAGYVSNTVAVTFSCNK